VLPVISGRVLAQVSTANAYNTYGIVEDARRYARAFKAEGIDKYVEIRLTLTEVTAFASRFP